MHILGGDVSDDELVTYTGPRDMLVAFLSGERVNRTDAALDESEWVGCKITLDQKKAMLKQLNLPG